MNTEERTITIVDDIMGSGKSTWAINYINDNPDRKFLCIVPLLSECERFKDGTDIDIVDPEKWGSKWKHFRWLVERKEYCHNAFAHSEDGPGYAGTAEE